ncbi:MAG: CxxxxCH/CxxCH domain-containing protein [Nitrospirae bacterium]|nr:CxxxxCH/CxxCH domain-containing protein [Nitrospirota bacterium]
MKDYQRKTLLILQVAGFILLLVFPCRVSALNASGDGNLLHRSQGEICEGCHRTNANTPSPGEAGYEQNNWGNAIKMHSSEIAGSCSDAAYETKTACVSNGGAWTPRKWAGSNGWGVAGGRYGEFVCETCHTFHATKNIYLIKENITAPGGTLPGGTVDFRYLTGAQGNAPYAMGDDSEDHTSSTRVCEVCHTATNYHRYDTSSQSDNGHNNASNCKACHSHMTGFVVACNTCHGASGPSGAPLISGDLVTGVNATGSLYAGKHQRHVADLGFTCETCHTGYIMPDSAGHAIDIGFTVFSAGGGSYDGQTTVNYAGSEANTTVTNSGSMRCGNMYCHSNGTSVSSGTIQAYTSDSWGSGVLTCASCHGTPPGYTNASPKANSHPRHNYMTCEKCHWNTTNTGNAISDYSKHVNNSYEIGNSAGTLTYIFSPSGGSCSGAFGCHGNATWGTTMPAQDYSNCVSCHKTARGNRRQIVDSNGDGSGTGGDFKKTSHHHNPASGTIAGSDCAVCHDTSQHPGGSVKLKNVDTGEVYIYNPSDPSSVENHCLSCHDTDGANGNLSPFSDGKTLGVAPYKMSRDIQTNWTKTYGHKQQGLTCLGNGNPGTGCHSNGHGSDYKGLLAKNLTLPLTQAGQGAPYRTDDEGAYELCFNCHSNYPRVTKEAVLGVKAGSNYDWDHWWGVMPPYYTASTRTNFKDRYDASGKPYDDQEGWRGPGEYYNLHFWHIQDGAGNGWKYRDSINSNVHCLTCHNVHGSNTQWGWVYDEMQYNHYDGQSGDKYGKMGLQNLNLLNSYPVSCAYNCHPATGVLNNWFEPAGE